MPDAWLRYTGLCIQENTLVRHTYARSVLMVAALWLAAPIAASDLSRTKVLETFSEYEELNADFVSSVATGHGSSGKPYGVLRKEVEAFSAGPFVQSLESAERLVCERKDAEVVAALFRVTSATSNSASEEPTWTLGRMFVCQPNLVVTEFKALLPHMQPLLYDALELGFENIVFRQKSARVAALRKKLYSLSPKVKP